MRWDGKVFNAPFLKRDALSGSLRAILAGSNTYLMTLNLFNEIW